MRKIVIFLVILSVLSVNAMAQENSTDNSKTPPGKVTKIILDTKNRTGHFVYIEEYYIIDSSGAKKLDQRRTFVDTEINSSKIQFRIIRPLDGSGNPYSDSMVKGIATIDNMTILNDWYRSRPKNNNGDPPVENKTTPGFEVLAVLAAMGLVSAGYLRRRR